MKTIRNILFAVKVNTAVSKFILPVMFLFVLTKAAVTIVDLFLIKAVIDFVLSDAFTVSKLLIYLMLYFFFMMLGKILIDIMSSIYFNKFEARFKNHTMSEIYKKILKIDLINYNNEAFYNKLNRALEASQDRCFIVLAQIFTFCSSLLVFLCVFSVYNDVIILLAVSINVTTVTLYHFLQNKKIYEYNKRNESFFRFGDYLNRVFSLREYAHELRTFAGIKEKLINRNSEWTDRYSEKYSVFNRRYFFNSALTETISGLTYFGASLYIAGLFLNVKISTGDFLVLLNAASCMSTQMIAVLEALPDLYQSSLYINDIREIRDYPCRSGNSECREDAESFEVLELKKIYFKYRTELPYVLQDISFSINKNETVALVGRNGAGKSTLIDCILGLMQPDEGCIELNGKKYDAYTSQSLTNMFSIVFQDFQIYNISIAENILMRKMLSEEDEAIVVESLKYVKLYDKVNSLEHGINTVISDNDESPGFSKGERQRVVIARAYARKSPVLIFDEPTSALDIYTANAFYESMFQMKELQNRTVIFTSHKLYHVVKADKILYLKDGTISEAGSHDELMALNGEYASLYKLQSKELFAKG